MAVIDTGSSSSGKANVDSNFNLQVNLPTTPEQAGFSLLATQNDSGTITGAPLVGKPRTSPNLRLKTALDTLLDSEVFNYSAQNTSKHIYRNTTMTNTWNTGFLLTNGSSTTTTTTGTLFQTYRSFPLTGNAGLRVEGNLAFSQWTTTNTTVDFGLFQAGATTPYAPTDGVFFRFNSTGGLGVISINGTETTTATLSFTPTLNTTYNFSIIIDERQVRYYINDVLYGTIDTPTASGNGRPLLAGTAPFSLRHAIAGGAAGAVLQVKLTNYQVVYLDHDLSKPYPHILCGAGQMAYQGQSGFTQGQTTVWTNSADPTAAAPTNTTAALGSGLGGIFRANAQAGAATDYIISSYQNPAGSTTITPRTLYITGIWISTVNVGAAVATTPTTLVYALGYGNTAVSLATAEAATTKAPRRIPLGSATFPVGAAIGAVATNGDIYRQFTAPIIVNPGEFVEVIGRFVAGTATASQVINCYIGFGGYFE